VPCSAAVACWCHGSTKVQPTRIRSRLPGEPALLRSIKRAKKKPPSTSSRVTNASSTIGGSVVDADNAAALSQLTLRARKAPPPLLPALSPSTSPVHVKEDIVAMPAPALPSSRPDDAGSCFSSAKEELHTKRHHARSASSSVMDASECSSEETSSSSVGGGAGGGRVMYDYLPTNPSRRRHKRQGHNTDHAPKVKRRLEVYESFITDALSTMQELLSHGTKCWCGRSTSVRVDLCVPLSL
jgi:hypothetical protein